MTSAANDAAPCVTCVTPVPWNQSMPGNRCGRCFRASFVRASSITEGDAP